MKLPKRYNKLTPYQRKLVKEEYIKLQEGRCFFCKQPLTEQPPEEIRTKWIDWNLFPSGFRHYPVHLQHDHLTGMTEGAVHMYCNAVM